MANVHTGELLNFQDYSPEHNERSARIDVEAVHTNQYNNAMTNSSYTYEEPKAPVEVAEQQTTPQSNRALKLWNNPVNNRVSFLHLFEQTNHNFWTIEYYQKYFDVQTSEVLERIISSVLPQKVSRNYFDERIKGKPDLYGPIWISVTLIFTIGVSGNIANYLQSANKEAVHWRYNYHLVSYAATAIFCYVWLVPLALWAALKWTTSPEGQDDIENQASTSPTMISLFCLYGYSLSIYIPVAILWTIQVSWLQWLFVLMAALVSGAVLIFWLLPALKKSKYSLILIGSILAFHFLLASGFMLYFFHVPDEGDIIPTVISTPVSTTVKV